YILLRVYRSSTSTLFPYTTLFRSIVNDGSKDDSIQKLIEAYELESVNFFIQGNIPTAEVRGIYKSKNPAFRKLTVVDKANGGKADRKSTRLNSSHVKISYAVFCLK